MPNGDPDWGITEYPKLEKFFAGISSILEDFAAQHNLKIQKYYHQNSTWSLQFRHPQGGVGRIQTKKDGNRHVIVRLTWWLDDYEVRKRFLKESDGRKCSLDRSDLQPLLEEMLRRILSWTKADFDQTFDHPDPKPDDAMLAQLERERQKYPIPKLS